MTQVIQHKRRIGAGAPGGPLTLAAGELAYNVNGQALYVGADAAGTVAQLVGIERQLEIHASSPAQAVDPAAGAKTFPIAKLKVPGGNIGEALTMSAADGTLAYAPIVASGQQFVGSAKGDTGAVQLTVAAGGGTVLPAPAVGNNGWYVIYDVAGATPPPASGVPGPFQIGDWLISNGTAWTHLQYGGIETQTAADISVTAPVTGGTNVQQVLESMQATEALHVVGPALSVVDQVALYTDATGKLIKAGPLITSLATAAYVNSENAAQDVIIDANAVFVAAQPAIDAAQDAAIAAKGDVFGTTVSVLDHVAAYSDITGKNIKDSALAIADIALKTDLTTLGNVVGTPPSVADHIATYSNATGLVIKDGNILSTDIVLRPELAALGDVKGPAVAVLDHIAVYADTTGKVIKNATKTIASIDAAIALKGDVFSTAPIAGALNLAVFADVGGKLIIDGGQSIASIKTYVDNAVGNIPGATPPDVFEPDMTGDGTVALPITWTGVKFDPANTPAAFTGLGTTASPLALVLVDGGTY